MNKNCTNFSWKRRNRSPKRPSSTPGVQKPPCKTSSFFKYICRHNRSYKHPNYASAMEELVKRSKR